MASFIKDIEEIRQRAIDKIEDGPVTATYKGDKDHTIKILNEALATEIVCVLRYMHHYFMATGVHGRSVANEFKEHADAERQHSEEIAERIQQLGGKPDYNPASLLQRSVSQYIEGETLADMIREDLIAERMVIEVYQQMIRYFGNNDPTTRRMIEHILGEEEEHASDLSDLLFIVDPHSGETEGRDPGADPLAIERLEEQSQRSSSSRRQRQAEHEEIPVGYSQDDREITARARGERHPNSKTDVKGRDREYDGVQRVASRNRSEKPGRRGVSMSSNRNAAKREEPEPLAGRETTSGAASDLPGVRGRPMNRRRDEVDVEADEVAEQPDRGGSSGGTRSAKLLQKNRKNKRAA